MFHNNIKISNINGFNVLTCNIDNIKSINIAVYFKQGSLFENKTDNGISHFVEHMLFKGTTNRNTRQIVEEIENTGGDINAYTGKTSTGFNVKVLKKHLNKGFEILADILQNSLFNTEDIEKEKQVVLSELKQVLDTPEDLIFDLLTQECFKKQALGQTILGDEKNIKSFNKDLILKFIKNNYTKQNITIIVTGNIKHEQIEQLTLKYFDVLPQGSKKNTYPKTTYTSSNIVKTKTNLEQSHFAITYNAYSYMSEEHYIVHLLNDILGGGMSSRIFQNIREKQGLGYNIYSFYNSYFDTGILGMYGNCEHDKVSLLANSFIEQITNIAKLGIEQQELQRAKNQAKSSIIMQEENPDNIIDIMFSDYFRYNKIRSQKEVLSIIDKINTQQIKQVAQQIIKSQPTWVLITTPQNKNFKL